MATQQLTTIDKEIEPNLRRLASGDTLAFDPVIEAIEKNYITGNDILHYLVDFFTKVSGGNLSKYSALDIIEANDALDLLHNYKGASPYNLESMIQPTNSAKSNP